MSLSGNSGNMFDPTWNNWGSGIQTEVNPLWTGMVKNFINNPLHGATILRYLAANTQPEAHDSRGRPDYLSDDRGYQATGIQYVADPRNPYKGIFCRGRNTVLQLLAGIQYVSSHEIYLAEDPGEVYILDDHYPKRQDRFVIQNINYYATGPAEPCQLGDSIAAWKIGLNRERFPVGANRA
jgi:hypothetical protein